MSNREKGRPVGVTACAKLYPLRSLQAHLLRIRPGRNPAVKRPLPIRQGRCSGSAPETGYCAAARVSFLDGKSPAAASVAGFVSADSSRGASPGSTISSSRNAGWVASVKIRSR